MNNSLAPPQPIMPEGRYAGRTLATIPPEYLRWVLESAAPEPLKVAVRIEMNRRLGEFDPTPHPEAERLVNATSALAAMLERIEQHAEAGDHEQTRRGLSLLSAEASLWFERLRALSTERST